MLGHIASDLGTALGFSEHTHPLIIAERITPEMTLKEMMYMRECVLIYVKPKYGKGYKNKIVGSKTLANSPKAAFKSL